MNIHEKINRKVQNVFIYAKFDLYTFELISAACFLEDAKKYLISSNIRGYIADSRGHILFYI